MNCVCRPGVRTVDLPKSFADLDILSICPNEHVFQEMLALSPSIWRSLGWSGVLKSDPFFPDVVAKLDDGQPLRVEVEYAAENFLRHRHPATADLVLSFTRKARTRTIASIPVWSFYQRDGDGFVWSLDNDIQANGYERPGEVCGITPRELSFCRGHDSAVLLIVEGFSASFNEPPTVHDIWSVGEQLGRDWSRTTVRKKVISLGLFDSGEVSF